MAHMLIACRNAVGCAVTTITECHIIQRVIPLTLIGKTDDRLAIRAPIASPGNASRNDPAHALLPDNLMIETNWRTHSCSWKAEKSLGRSILPTLASSSRGRMAS